jgi:hypothetical protein
VIQIIQGTTLDGQIRKIGGQSLSPGHRAIQEHSSRASFGTKVLKEEAGHASCPNHGNLFLIQGNRFLETSGLTNFQLS